MPRQRKAPYLYLKRKAGRPAYYVIRDGGREIGIGGSEVDRQAAEDALVAYLIERHDPRPTGECRPDQMTIATAMDIYLREHTEVRDPVRISFATDRI